MLWKLILLLIIDYIIAEPSCKKGEKFCKQCNPITKLCTQCQYDILIPDKNGGCTGQKKCTVGKNYCSECDEEEKKCEKCEIGFYQDQNGGCSFVDNCEISNKGFCLKCISDFILVGGENDMGGIIL